MAEITASARVFQRRADDYDAWFDRNPLMFAAEVRALRELLDPVLEEKPAATGLEIGVGSGRFAEQLGLEHGVDPAPRMVSLARSRGIWAVEGRAESLPFGDSRFDITAIITTLCFVDDADASLREARRVTAEGGVLLLAYLDADGPGAERLTGGAGHDSFYAKARLRDGAEIRALLESHGFVVDDSRQVIDDEGVPVVRPGVDEGLFCAVRAVARPRHEERNVS